MAIRNAIVLDSSSTSDKTIVAIRRSGSKIKYRKHAVVSMEYPNKKLKFKMGI